LPLRAEGLASFW